jgi:hypothetical protein
MNDAAHRHSYQSISLQGNSNASDQDTRPRGSKMVFLVLILATVCVWTYIIVVSTRLQNDNPAYGDSDYISDPVMVRLRSGYRNAFNSSRNEFVTCLMAVESSRVVFPWDIDYNRSIETFSKFYEHRSAIAVVYPKDEKAVVAMVECAYEHNIRIIARCGGHGNSGQSGGQALIIDVSLLTGMRIIADGNQLVTGSGNTVGKVAFYVNKVTNGTRLLPIGQKPSVGISGITLGGGFGFTTTAYGLMCDRLIRIEGVLTNGTIVYATKSHHEKLFWASCGGGGGSFLIVTSFTFL